MIIIVLCIINNYINSYSIEIKSIFFKLYFNNIFNEKILNLITLQSKIILINLLSLNIYFKYNLFSKLFLFY